MSNAAIVVLCALTLGVTVYVAATLPGGAGGDDGSLDARLAVLEEHAESAKAMQAELRDAVARVDRRLQTLTSRASAAADASGAASASGAAGSDAAGPGSADAAAGKTADAGSASDVGGVSAAGAVGDAVAERIEQRIEATLARERARGQDGKWKAPIDELTKELDVDPAKKTEIVRVLDDGRDKLCALLLQRRDSGTSVLDDLGAELRDGKDPGATSQAFLKRLFVEKVPNGDQTYIAEIMQIHEGVERELAQRLDAGRMEKLRALRVDLLDVKTGHDPVGEALRVRMTQAR